MSTPLDIPAIVARFAVSGSLSGFEPYGGGHINDSFVVVHEGGGGRARHLLQRLNRAVFPEPVLVMENVVHVTQHIARRLRREGATDALRRVLTLVPSREGAAYVTDVDGDFWRLYLLVEGTRSADRVNSPAEALETGRAFGRFGRLLADYEGPRLHDTIPGFHDTPRRCADLRQAAALDRVGRSGEVREEIDAVLSRRDLAGALLEPHARGEIPERIVHNDTKITNVLFDSRSGEGICVVDLDTVMPGLSLYDFGDIVRSLASGTAEDERELGAVAVRLEIFEALARGFLEMMGDSLNTTERALLVTAAQVITMEQAARFLSDYLRGDLYYRIQRPGQNLDRARAQLRLLESLELEEQRLGAIVKGL